MAAVLQLLGFQAHSSRGAQQRGPCPLHGSTSGTSRCFSVTLDQHTFHCFKCGPSGNALDLWAAATGQLPYCGATVSSSLLRCGVGGSDAAIDLCNRLGIPLPTPTDSPYNGNDLNERLIIPAEAQKYSTLVLFWDLQCPPCQAFSEKLHLALFSFLRPDFPGPTGFKA
jgi:hypothetical protein